MLRRCVAHGPSMAAMLGRSATERLTGSATRVALVESTARYALVPYGWYSS